MKSEWKDITSYSRGDQKREQKSFELKAGVFRVSVSRWCHGEPDVWYLSCDSLCIEFRELNAATIEYAQKEAVEIVRGRIVQALEAIDD